MSSILDADRIYVVEQGRCVETGSWEELSARDGVFSRLKAAQFGGAVYQVDDGVVVADATSGRATAIQGQ